VIEATGFEFAVIGKDPFASAARYPRATAGRAALIGVDEPAGRTARGVCRAPQRHCAMEFTLTFEPHG